MAGSVRQKFALKDDLLLSTLPIFVLVVGAAIWFQKVSSIVTEPYLDEVFHVDQARLYIQNQWQAWNPKITTPPGLYIIGYLWNLVIPIGSDLQILRSVNLLAITVIIPWKALNIRRHIISQSQVKYTNEPSEENLVQSAWVAANVGLFPPLFFFSALFYTDLWSVFWVLQSIETSQAPEDVSRGSLFKNIKLITFGLTSLWFRQTNIFWVAIFAGGMDVIRTVKSIDPRLSTRQLEGYDWLEVFTISWNERKVYDPPVGEADFQDYLKTGFSIAIGILGGITPVLRCLVPYGLLLSVFAGFVAWNGGVVLGDKSNHVATLHMTQMVYIWPYIFFFSFPLIITTILSILPQSILPASIRTNLIHRKIPIVSIAGFSIVVLAIIHFNTTIHPFTLADNRHYVFYVFRWFILGKPWLRYIWAPGYVVCGWMVIQSLGRSEVSLQRVGIMKKSTRQKRVTSYQLSEGGDDANRVSFVLVWFITSFLSLATAPLVEPRYFILPWLIWRLHVPNPQLVSKTTPNGGDDNNLYSLWSRYGLIVETLWFLVINAGTGHLFLYKGFKWPQEPTVVQRFMW